MFLGLFDEGGWSSTAPERARRPSRRPINKVDIASRQSEACVNIALLSIAVLALVIANKLDQPKRKD